MRTVAIEDIICVFDKDRGRKPTLEHYFSPSKKAHFIKEFLHYLNTSLLEARHGELHREQYLALILSFQLSAPLLEIPAEKELGLFYRILQKTCKVEEIDLNLHFSMAEYEGALVGEQEKAISGALEKQTGKKVELALAVDAELLGGLQAEIAGRLFDGSLRSQLKRIEDTLTKG